MNESFLLRFKRGNRYWSVMDADLTPQDPMAAARHASCDACLDDFLRREQCYRASAGHPNVIGAQKFADAIIAALA